ncbi:pilus assembly protein [Vibrio europaeus]|uniref:Pilus assembly protein n=1 Tax=Vibrio europaeus TaxID=300876 RepID=A0A178JDW7_9VIBR|nr:TadE family protein [Vibrio europaeus]MDC5707543.1 pilus assembly protein [Vibrio europaeus]MDC5709789.1 pilus assembly protein [Vibrio europaeus]MDC5716734.1 pilus assembly protein [Vibrio europaeus]MDC5722645.1 pilus assembly protein [Vibrio europaeus]MDC5727054.1 pilus assembly protein [Vibrio europaeus]
MRILRKQRGVASIEFGLGFMAFFLMIMLWAEMGYLAYVSSANDLAIAEASRSAKTTNMAASRGSQQTQFMTEFKRIIREQAGVLGNIIDPDRYKLTVHYFASIEELGQHNGAIDDTCSQNESQSEAECGNPTDSALAIYRVEYDYTPMLAFFMQGSSSLTREVVVIQEFERDQFKI